MYKERKKTKSMLSFNLSLALAIAALSGCGAGGEEKSGTGAESPKPSAGATPESTAPETQYGDTGGLKLPLVSQPTTLKWMVSSETPDLKDKLIVKEIEKRTGIKLELLGYSAATYNDKLKVVLASGELPDLISGLSLTEANKLGAQGALVPINTYADQLPNFKKLYMEENNWVMKSFTDEKNNLYSWPIHGLNRDVNHGFLYRKDIFDKLGIQEWTTTEQFYQALKKLKEAYPKSYPFASKTKEVMFSDLAYGWGIGGTGTTTYPGVYDEKSKQWKLATIQPEYKEMLDFLKKLYKEGLLDPEFLTDTPASWTAKMTSNDQAFVTFDWIGRLDLFYNQVKEQNPAYNLRYGNPVGPTGNIRTLPKIEPIGVQVANNKNKEAALKLLDYLSSPSGALLETVGIEGSTFKWDAKGKPEYMELKDVPLVDIKVLGDRYGLWLANMYVRVDPRSVYFNFTEKEQEAQDKINKSKKYEPSDPVLKWTAEETTFISDIKPSLDKAANEFSAKYVLTDSFGDKEWQDWVKSAEKLGAAKLVEVYNAAQKRYDAGN